MSDAPASTPAVTVHSLVGATQAALAVKCLGSLRAAVFFPVRFLLHDDGSLDPGARDRLLDALGGTEFCTFVDRRAAGEQVAERLRNHPRCAQFRETNLFGPKLFDVPLLSVGRAVYVDTDVLWTRPVACPEYFTGGGPAFVVMRDLQEAYAVRLSRWPNLQRRGIQLASRFCAGMMSLDPAALDLDYVEWLLGVDASDNLFDGFRFWAEQTIYAALAARAGCAWIEPGECAVVHHRNYSRVRHAAILHFAGFSRDLFEGRYREVDLRAIDRVPAQILHTKPTPECSLARRVLSAVQNRVLRRTSQQTLSRSSHQDTLRTAGRKTGGGYTGATSYTFAHGRSLGVPPGEAGKLRDNRG